MPLESKSRSLGYYWGEFKRIVSGKPSQAELLKMHQAQELWDHHPLVRQFHQVTKDCRFLTVLDCFQQHWIEGCPQNQSLEHKGESLPGNPSVDFLEYSREAVYSEPTWRQLMSVDLMNPQKVNARICSALAEGATYTFNKVRKMTVCRPGAGPFSSIKQEGITLFIRMQDGFHFSTKEFSYPTLSQALTVIADEIEAPGDVYDYIAMLHDL